MNNTALILFRALPEFKACAPWIQELAEAAFIRGMEEGKRQCGPNDRISGIRLVKLMQGQRDECAEVLREIMAKLREQFGPTCMDQSIDPHAWTLAWETLTSRAYAVLSKCPSYAQQVQNICDGLGITREELDEALKRIPATGERS